MTHEWMDELKKEENNKEFSELCHSYFQLAVMRCMQTIREKYQVPEHEINTLVIAIFARFLNEGTYAVGSAIRNGMNMNDILSKQMQLAILQILQNEPLNAFDRKDVDEEYKRSSKRLQKFILETGPGFYI